MQAQRKFQWRQASPGDIDAILAIQAIAHADFPEDKAVLAERLALCPKGCFVLVDGDEVHGYLLSHPWKRCLPPPLNRPLGAVPDDADCWYLHDLALLPMTRGSGAGAGIVAKLMTLAHDEGYGFIGLVSVGGSRPFWRKQHFVVETNPMLAEKLASYGDGAAYMERKLP
ncbi:GNAT superfamily N-acetyltransferase [Pararhizobium capsulatum DSM 1112]|uniref:GNAT superfamily N-acetyltransferase n=1 Tax=Pararhizobium capsulatum DSM 1112 TaxID=1121113 RepID=A0ABU0BU16_9HYPH|nr:GNAT family N-acetyltransferase [Pararhizobium capsulatum]MDQ0321754.1 GNAT superfamily N-acetyltransferase [Pararhizobium capsulatum DSM 1112]